MLHAPGRPVFTVTPGLIWGVLVLASIFAAVASVPIAPADFWWHLRAGEQVLDRGALLTEDIYSFTRAGHPYMHLEWLAAALFAVVDRLGGLAGLPVAGGLLFAAGYGCVLLSSRDACGSTRMAAVATAASFGLSVENWALRPQDFTVALLPGTLLLLRRYADGWLPARYLVALPLLTAVWANLHGGFVLGLVAQGIALCGLAVERLGVPVGPEPARLPRPPLPPLLVTVIASAAAVCLNPWGPAAYWYIWSFATEPVHRTFILEWAATSLDVLPGRLLLLYAAGLVAAVLASRREQRVPDLLLVPAFGLLALTSVRHIIWFGMVTAPVLARGMTELFGRLPLRRVGIGATLNDGAGLGAQAAGPIALAWVILVSLAPTPWVRQHLPLPPERRGVIAADTPVAAASALAALPPGRRTFHDMQYGSYLIWATAPAQPVFIDPRVELYPFGQWADYGTIAAGLNAAALLDRYQIDTLLLDRQRQAGLLAAVTGDPAWTQVYADPTAVIFRRAEEAAP